MTNITGDTQFRGYKARMGKAGTILKVYKYKWILRPYVNLSNAGKARRIGADNSRDET